MPARKSCGNLITRRSIPINGKWIGPGKPVPVDAPAGDLAVWQQKGWVGPAQKQAGSESPADSESGD